MLVVLHGCDFTARCAVRIVLFDRLRQLRQSARSNIVSGPDVEQIAGVRDQRLVQRTVIVSHRFEGCNVCKRQVEFSFHEFYASSSEARLPR